MKKKTNHAKKVAPKEKAKPVDPVIDPKAKAAAEAAPEPVTAQETGPSDVPMSAVEIGGPTPEPACCSPEDSQAGHHTIVRY